MITLKSWWSPAKNWTPGADSSNLISNENAVPIIPENIENIKYSVPLEMEENLSASSPQRTVRATHTAYGSIDFKFLPFFTNDVLDRKDCYWA